MALRREPVEATYVAALPTDHDSAARPPRPLSPRQRDVLTLLARGYSCGQVAQELEISASVVHQHALLAESKLRASGREQAIAIATAIGEIKPQE